VLEHTDATVEGLEQRFRGGRARRGRRRRPVPG
jgi:hypothetical protein